MADRQIILGQISNALQGFDTTFILKGSSCTSERRPYVDPNDINLNEVRAMLTKIADCKDFAEITRNQARGISQAIGTDDYTVRFKVVEFLKGLIDKAELVSTESIEDRYSGSIVDLIKIFKDPGAEWTSGNLDKLAKSSITDVKCRLRATVPEDKYPEYLDICYANFSNITKGLAIFINDIVNDSEMLFSMENIKEEGLARIVEFSKAHSDFVSRVVRYLQDCRSNEPAFLQTNAGIEIKEFIAKGLASGVEEVRTFFTGLDDALGDTLRTNEERAAHRQETGVSPLMSKVKKGLKAASVSIDENNTLTIGNHTIDIKRMFYNTNEHKTDNFINFAPLIKVAQQATWTEADLKSLAEIPSMEMRIADIQINDVLTLKDILRSTIPETLYPRYLEYKYASYKAKLGFSIVGLLEELLRNDSQCLKQLIKGKPRKGLSGPSHAEDSNLRIYSEEALKRMVDFADGHSDFLPIIISKSSSKIALSERGWWGSLDRFMLLAIIESAKQYESTRAFALDLEMVCKQNDLLYKEAK